MERMTLGWVAQALGLEAPDRGHVPITGVSIDTRSGCDGALFIALRGERTDGHAFLGQAAAANAAAAIVARPDPVVNLPQLVVDDPLLALGKLARAYADRYKLVRIGVTGSVGKTSVRAMIGTILATRFAVCASLGNHNNEIGVPLTLLSLEGRHTALVTELAMRGSGQIAYLAEMVQPSIGVITGIGVSHIELLGTRERIAQAKAELLDALPRDGTAVLPADDPYLSFLKERAPADIRTFGYASDADFVCRASAPGPNGEAWFTVNGVGFDIGAPGVHHARNGAAACAAAAALGLSVEDCAEALQGFRTPEMRMEALRAPGDILVLNDAYNAAPDSVRAALDTLAETARATGRRPIAVLGDMKELGAYAEDAHRQAIEAADRSGVHLLVAVGSSMADAHARAGSSAVAAVLYPDSTSAADRIRRLVQAGDVVLVKGSRAMELDRVVQRLMQGGEAEP